MTKQAPPTTPKRTPAAKKLDAAVKRAYKEYGPDLTKFFATVMAELAKTKQKTMHIADSRFLKSR